MLIKPCPFDPNRYVVQLNGRRPPPPGALNRYAVNLGPNPLGQVTAAAVKEYADVSAYRNILDMLNTFEGVLKRFGQALANELCCCIERQSRITTKIGFNPPAGLWQWGFVWLQLSAIADGDWLRGQRALARRTRKRRAFTTRSSASKPPGWVVVTLSDSLRYRTCLIWRAPLNTK